MSYQVLARKWRPATFTEVVGQKHVLTALTNALTQNRLHHAYLFSGTRGTGKTTLARLFAKGLNCDEGITATPCGTCSSCLEIAAGSFIDLIEVDAASRTKVDDTREILENVQYRPTRGRFKVYLIDEVHMLSKSSFNALLKTLEEPPEYIKFLFATTDPHKLPITVLSRCLQFNLKSLTIPEITEQVGTILKAEDIKSEPLALKLIAKAANGSMRDALSLADQAIAFGAGEVILNQVQTMLGSLDEAHSISLFNLIVQGDIDNLITELNKIMSYGADADEIIRSLLELLHQIALAQFTHHAIDYAVHSDLIIQMSKDIEPEQIQLYYQIFLNGRKDLTFAPDPKLGLEMIFIRAVAFLPQEKVSSWPKVLVKDEKVNTTIAPIEQYIDTDIGENENIISEQRKIIDQAESLRNLSSIPFESKEKQIDTPKENISILDGVLAAREALVSGNIKKDDIKEQNVEEQNARSHVEDSLNYAKEDDLYDNHSEITINESENYSEEQEKKEDEIEEEENSVIQDLFSEGDSLPDSADSALNIKVKELNEIDIQWFRLTEKLDAGIAQQLAKNSSCKSIADEITLILKEDKQHLLSEKEKLENQLSVILNKDVRLRIDLGVDSKAITPVDMVARLKTDVLEEAKKLVQSEAVSAWFIENMGGKVVEVTPSDDLFEEKKQRLLFDD